jgi:integrase
VLQHIVTHLGMTPYSVAGYLAESAQTLQASTVARRLHAVRWGHEGAGFPSPTRDAIVCNVMAGVRRLKGTTQERKQPLSLAALRKMFATAPDDLRTRRDRALLLVGCAAHFSRRELVGLRYQDVQFTDAGLVITVPKWENNPDGQAQKAEIPYSSDPELCPVRALAAWLERSHISSGYLFPALGRWQRNLSGKPLCNHQLANTSFVSTV